MCCLVSRVSEGEESDGLVSWLGKVCAKRVCTLVRWVPVGVQSDGLVSRSGKVYVGRVLLSQMGSRGGVVRRSCVLVR